MAEPTTLIFRASLEPRLYRDIEVPEACTLYRLAEAIISSFGFDFDHAFGFYSKLKGHFLDSPRRYELFADMGEAEEGALGVEKTLAAEAFARVGSKMLFLFDYGDEWLFVVELVKRQPRQGRARLPRLLVSSGEAPEQYPSVEEEEEEE